MLWYPRIYLYCTDCFPLFTSTPWGQDLSWCIHCVSLTQQCLACQRGWMNREKYETAKLLFVFPGFPCDQSSFLYLMFQSPSFWSTSKPWWKQSNNTHTHTHTRVHTHMLSHTCLPRSPGEKQSNHIHTHTRAHTHALTDLQEDKFTHPVWSWWNSAMEESWTA